MRQIAQRKVVSRLAFQDLGEGISSHGGLNRILHVGDVDLVTGGGFAVHSDVQIGLAEHAKDSKIFNAFNPAHDADDLIALVFQHFQIVAIDLRGQRAFHSAHGLFHVVFDGLRKAPDDAGNFVQLAIHGGNQFVFVLVKHRPPLFFRLQVDEVFGIKEAGVIRSVIGTAHLAGALRHFGERAEHDSRLVRDPDTLVRPGAGRKRAAHPQCAFIEVGQEFRTDDAAEREDKPPRDQQQHTPQR